MERQRTYLRKDFIKIVAGAAIALPALRLVDAPEPVEAHVGFQQLNPSNSKKSRFMHVHAINFSHQLHESEVRLETSVHIRAGSSNVADASVSVRFVLADGSIHKHVSKTDGNGIARFARTATGYGTYRFNVTSIKRGGLIYNSKHNLVTSASINVDQPAPVPVPEPENPPPTEGSLNVRDFGALGNGSADDSPAIQSAIDAAAKAGGGTIYFPAGTYMLGSTVWLKPGARLQGEHRDQVTLASRMNMNALEIIDVDNVAFANLSLKGIAKDASWGYGVLVWDAKNLTFESCRFADLPDAALYLMRAHEVTVTGCEFQNIRTSGVRLAPAGAGFSNSQVRIRENTFVGINHARIGGHSAIHCHGEPGAKNEYLWIENNHIESQGIGIGLDDVDYATVTGNRIIGNGAEGEGIAFTGSHNVISGNVINNAYAAGILNWAVAYRSNENNVISANTCWDNSQGIAIVCGEQHSVISNLEVRNNRCYAEKSDSRQQYGVQHYIDGASDFKWQNVRIVDNDLRGNTVWAYNVLPPADAIIENNLV